MKAAVMRAQNAPLVIEDLHIDDPGPGEVLVKTMASGICHSDLHVIEGGLPMPPPCVLGHEPAGIVEAVGPDVTSVAPGDHIIACLSRSSLRSVGRAREAQSPDEVWRSLPTS